VNNKAFPLQVELCIPTPTGDIRYTFPNSFEEFILNDYLWFCPALYSLFNVYDFYKILTAVLLERSLVFVSDNITILSSTILGLKGLLKPFQWCYALVPVLPNPLINMLDIPQPILVGVTKRDYKTIDLTDEEKSFKTWVFLDDNSVRWSTYDEDMHDKTVLRWAEDLVTITKESFLKFNHNALRLTDHN
jgi:hypothetical protein